MIKAARLYALLDGGPSEQALAAYASTLLAAGVHVLQLRDKRLGDRATLSRARLLRELTRETKTLLIVNDRVDLAILSQADGVHVGQEELTVPDVRRLAGRELLVGVSTHSLVQVQQAARDGADYLGVGPVFPSGTKQFSSYVGLKLLRQVIGMVQPPIFAIGGITLENLDAVLATGIDRVAISGALGYSDDPGITARKLLSRLQK